MIDNAEEPKLATVLAADVGNTHFTLGGVRGEHAYTSEKVPVSDLARLSEVLGDMWSAMAPPRRVVAASVNPPALAALASAVAETLDEEVAVVGRDVPLPIETTLAEPEKVGVDRLCCAFAAWHRLQKACVVVDLGSAITIDCVNGDGVFVGGMIMPGMEMQAEALHRGTVQLPVVELRRPDWVFGRNTDEAIVGGIVTGVRMAMRGIIELYATELGVWPIVILTGGDAELIGLDDGVVQAIVSHLSLTGIALAFYKAMKTLAADVAGELGDET